MNRISENTFDDFVPQPVPGWTHSICDDNHFVTDPDRSLRYKLNGMAPPILQLCDGKRTNREIIEAAAELNEANSGSSSYVISILSALKNAGLVSNWPSVTFATACWEEDWRKLLLEETYLSRLKIGNHGYGFQECALIINNVSDAEAVTRHARLLVSKKILTSVHGTEEIAERVLEFFGLSRSLFVTKPGSRCRRNIDDDWIYYNALAPLSAIFNCTTDYLLYMTGDSFLKERVQWVGPALRKLEGNASYKVANPTWNDCYEAAANQSAGIDGDFYVSEAGFSDQCFLVATRDVRAPIFNDLRNDAGHFPHGETFEKRLYCHMLNSGWKRLIYRHGSYWHENIVPGG